MNSKQLIETTVRNLLSTCGIEATSSHIKKTIRQHPDYPSTLSIVETLPEWGVTSEGVRGGLSDLTEIDYPSIVRLEPSAEIFADFRRRKTNIPLGDRYAVLKSRNSNNVTLIFPSKGHMTINIEEFGKIWNGVLIRAHVEDNAGEKNYEAHRREEKLVNQMKSLRQYGLPTAVLLSLILVVNEAGASIAIWSLLALKLIGLVLCTIMATGAGQRDGLLNSLCPVGVAINCQRVLASPAGKIFGIPMADIGIVYFAGGLLTLFIAAGMSTIAEVSVLLGALSLLALPYTIFSIVYQGAVLRSWCWMCLIVQALFWIEFMLLYDQLMVLPFKLGSGLITFGSTSFLLGFVLAALGWTALKSVLQISKSEDLNNEIIRLRSNPDYVKSELNNSERRDLGKFPLELTYGNSNANLHITSVVNPLCRHCGRSLAELMNIVELGRGNIKATIRFLVRASSDENTEIEQKLDYEVSRIVLSLVANGESEIALMALRTWFNAETSSTAGKFKKWCGKYNSGFNGSLTKATRVVLDSQIKWAKKNKIMSTPTIFINGLMLPSNIQLSYLKYFVIRNVT